ncbi:proline reductase cluster protein PrdD [Companilactobacillus mishanensis]|uniref:Proline reductase cluster protein PrdD n=1 Tax=Companilactobacillus mishanensis TaxID=2486008 RepID=A0ABW9P766_9LACO|nr:proline reductase cluster protein PrdD [Companilactobacillus mishanensis]MQS44949.1 proline reductase cluster protein PrdD [Companilactobacillus mishanensis]
MKKNTLNIKAFSMQSVKFGTEYHLTKNSLEIPDHALFDLDDRLKEMTIKLVDPRDCHFEINTIMDVMPISTKVLGELGYGLTHTLTGVNVILTGADETGVQLHEFGSSDGYLDQKIMFGRDGTPDLDDVVILIDVVLKENFEFNRDTCEMVFRTADKFLQPIREELKMLMGRDATDDIEYVDTQNPGQPKVAVVKEVAGQGAMYDNIIFPKEPAGIEKGISIIDMDNMPVLLTANEYRDGAIHALV